MYCENCGIEVDENATFCSQCGHPLMKKEQSFIDDAGNQEKKEDTFAFQHSRATEREEDAEGVFKETFDYKQKFQTAKKGIMKGLSGRREVVSLKLKSPAPLDDGLRKYNFIYVIMIILFLLISGLKVGGAIVGLFFGWAIKTVVASNEWEKLDWIRYEINKKPTKEEILKDLIPSMAVYGMFGEIGQDAILVSRSGYQYKISYSDDEHFVMEPSASILKEPSSLGRITRYKNAVIDLGIIGYLITCICDGNDEELQRYAANSQAFASNYIKSRKETWKSAIITVVAFLIALACFVLSMGSDYSDEIRSVTLYGTECTVDEAFSTFFHDLKWDTYSSDTEGYYLVEGKGKCYYVIGDKASPVTCIVEFVYQPESGVAYVQQVKAGERVYMDSDEISEFLQDVYGYENMTQPNSIEGFLEGYANALISGANNHLFGKYISYEEGKQLY